MTDPIRTFLTTLDRDALIELLVAEAERDERLAERLRLRSAVADPADEGIRALKQAINRATRTYGYLHYRDVRGYASGVDEVADLIDGFIDDGRPDAAIALAEHALSKLEKALDHADDSDGLIGDLLARFQRIHLRACTAARPNPVKLAERLFRWEFDGDWDVFRGAAETYAEVLGVAGLARYRELAEPEWRRVPTLAPVADGRDRWDSNRFSITYMMESLARAFGDVDIEIAVRSRDLSSAYQFLEIAEVCRRASRDDEALDWAERGVRAFPTRTDGRLREFLADEYVRRSRGEDAMAVVWAQFEEQPALGAFEVLKQYADRLGTWALWRPRAIAEVRWTTEQAISAASAPRRGGPNANRWAQPADGSRLVEILLLESRLDEAWSEATTLGCSRAVWLRLAGEREADHPADAVPIYRQEIERLLQVTDKRNYAEAVELLKRMAPLMTRVGRDDEFAAFVATTRAANARRPAFISLLNAAALTQRPSLLRAVE
jgi:hypothetical protein